MMMKNILRFCGVDADSTSHLEKAISAVGGLVAVFLVTWVSLHFVGKQGAAIMLASTGASVVLLFAAPHSAFSQPWSLLGGNAVSALIGVACAQNISNPLLAAPLCVALAIVAMHYLRCIHPPGGAVALTAVIGSTQIHELGYQFVLAPVLFNATILFVVAIALNYAFPWRRYPSSLKKQPVESRAPSDATPDALSHADFDYALREIGSYVDISEDDLAKIYSLATEHAQRSATREADSNICTRH